MNVYEKDPIERRLGSSIFHDIWLEYIQISGLIMVEADEIRLIFLKFWFIGYGVVPVLKLIPF